MMEKLKYICRHYNRPAAATKEEACHPKVADRCKNGCPGPMTLEKYNQMVEINARAKEEVNPNVKEVKAVAETKNQPCANILMCETEGCDKAQWSKAEGLCQSCYRKKYPPRHAKPNSQCKECGNIGKLKAIGLCEKCYKRAYNKNYQPPLNKGECLAPGCTFPPELKGLCRSCYARRKYQEYKKLKEKSELQLSIDRGQTNKRKKIKAANNPADLREKINGLIEKKEEAASELTDKYTELLRRKIELGRQIEALKTVQAVLEE